MDILGSPVRLYYRLNRFSEAGLEIQLPFKDIQVKEQVPIYILVALREVRCFLYLDTPLLSLFQSMPTHPSIYNKDTYVNSVHS